MKHFLRIFIVSLISIVFDSGCIRITRIPYKTTLGSHQLSVTPDCQSVSTHSERRTEEDGSSRILYYEFKCGDTTVLIKDNSLNVNGSSYGTLNDGDMIAVNYGRVTVNSASRPADQ
ncbi:MAG TPA: hypothetical protein VMS31_14380 [Pyrinomonadaceae bacterium]|nr:hypothetical protein [Pyrinomonadaceae bacterium]